MFSLRRNGTLITSTPKSRGVDVTDITPSLSESGNHLHTSHQDRTGVEDGGFLVGLKRRLRQSSVRRS